MLGYWSTILCHEERVWVEVIGVQGPKATGGSSQGGNEGLRGEWPLHPSSNHGGSSAVSGKHPDISSGSRLGAHVSIPGKTGIGPLGVTPCKDFFFVEWKWFYLVCVFHKFLYFQFNRWGNRVVYHQRMIIENVSLQVLVKENLLCLARFVCIQS